MVLNVSTKKIVSVKYFIDICIAVINCNGSQRPL